MKVLQNVYTITIISIFEVVYKRCEASLVNEELQKMYLFEIFGKFLNFYFVFVDFQSIYKRILSIVYVLANF